MKPNIIYIHSHDTGKCIQPYGYPVDTPHLQKFAEEGVLFRNSFCANPTCSPSRAALLTGSYPHQNGMFGLAHLGFKICDYKKHLNFILKKNGYITALSGIQHIIDEEKNDNIDKILGYDKILNRKVELNSTDFPGWTESELSIEAATRLNSQVVENAVNFLEEEKGKQFFLSVGFFDTHRDFPSEKDLKVNPDYCIPFSNLPDTPEVRLDTARFYTAVKRLDRDMGIIFDTVDRLGLRDNTLIICTTDHGPAFPGMKCNLNDLGTGVMLMIRGPGGFEGGKVIDSMTSHLNIYPTLCELLGIDRPEWLEGKSLFPLVNGDSDSIHDEIFSEINYHVAYEPMRCIRTQKWKYIKRFDNRNKPVLPNCDDGETKSYLLRKGYQEQKVAEEQLYDLIFDPSEMNNLAYKTEFSEICNDMRNRLRIWMENTDDPLIKGKIAAPKGAKVGSPDGISNLEELYEVN